MSSFLDGTGLGHLIEKIKATFIAKTDTTVATSIGIDSTPTTNSTNLVTSGGVKSALDNKANSSDLSTVATTGSYNDLSNKPTIPTVNNSTITILKNSSTVNSFTLNQSSNKTINITVPTTASDVSALPASTKYGASLSVSIDSTTYIVTALLKDLNGNNLGTAQTIDLPLESVVVSGSYDSATKKVVLTLKDGSTIDFSIADLVSGLLTEITSTNKLSADLIEDGTTNKVINVQSDWNVSDTTSNAYILNKPSIPVDSNLVHKTGNETISGTKTFGGSSNIKLSSTIERHVPELITGNTLKFDWIKIHADLTEDDLTLQQALDERNNVQADWNQTTTTAADYIKNKPTIPTTSTTLVEDDPNPVSGGAVYDVIVENEQITSAALNDLNERIDGIPVYDSTNKLSADFIEDGKTNKVINVKPDWNAASGNAAEILNKPSNIVTGASTAYIIWCGTQAQYDALLTYDNNTVYLIKETV